MCASVQLEFPSTWYNRVYFVDVKYVAVIPKKIN